MVGKFVTNVTKRDTFVTSGNIAEVFGDTAWRMVLQVFSSFGDGLTYPQRFIEDPEMGLANGSSVFGHGSSNQRTHRQPADTLSEGGGSLGHSDTLALNMVLEA